MSDEQSKLDNLMKEPCNNKEIDSFKDPNHVLNFKKDRTIPTKAIKKWLDIYCQISNEKSDNVLDLGCGTGRFTIEFAKTNKNLIYAIDRSQAMIKLLQQSIEENNLKNIITEVVDFPNWSNEEFFNIVFISETLQFVSNISSLTQSICNKLAEDSYVLVRSPSHEQLENIEWLSCFDNLLTVDKQRTTNTDELISVFSQHNLQLVLIEEIDESQTLDRSEYLRPIINKSYSILHTINQAQFENGITSLLSSIKDKKNIKHTMKINALLFKYTKK